MTAQLDQVRSDLALLFTEVMDRGPGEVWGGAFETRSGPLFDAIGRLASFALSTPAVELTEPPCADCETATNNLRAASGSSTIRATCVRHSTTTESVELTEPPNDEIQRLRDDMQDALGINEQVIAEYDALRTAIEFAGWCPVRQEDGSFKLEVYGAGPGPVELTEPTAAEIEAGVAEFRQAITEAATTPAIIRRVLVAARGASTPPKTED